MLQLITGAPNQPFFSGVPVGPPSAQQGWGGPPRERETSSAPRPPCARTAAQPQPQPVAPSDGVSRHPWTLSSFSVAGIALLSLGPLGPSCPASGRRARLPAGHHGVTCGPFQAPQVRFYVSDSLRRRTHPGRALFRTALRPRLPPAPGPTRPCAALAARARPLLAPPRIAPSRAAWRGVSFPFSFFGPVGLSCHHPSVDPAVRPVLEPALCVDCPKNTFPCKTYTRLRHRVPVGVILCCTDVLRNI